MAAATAAHLDLSRPHAVVTGASSGIGLAIARRMLAEGWRVTGLCRTLPAQGGTPEMAHLRIVTVDLSDPKALAQACTQVCAGGEGDRVDALVHAAGFMRTAPLGALSQADAGAMWQLHVLAAEALANQLLPKMASPGRILLVGSRVANGAPERSQYAATKAALVGMARSWAAELAPRGITVNVIAPGATETPFLQQPGRASSPPRLPPIGRYIQPDEVAALAAFLLGPQAGAITGQQIVMCGGSSL